LAVVALSLACAAAVAEAQPQAGDREEAIDPDVRAQALFARGRRAYEVGRFEEALDSFELAYELSARPELLFNMGQAADRLGRTDRAANAFAAYLRERPDAPNREYVEGRLQILEANGAPGPNAQVEEDGQGLSAWPFVAFGVACAAGVAATILWIDANATYDDLETTCAPTCTEAMVDESGVSTSQTLAQVFLGVGVAAAAAGVVLLVVGGDDDDEGTSVDVGLHGVRLRGRW
jgi:tetratricopeptide (TPR) repeat protein